MLMRNGLGIWVAIVSVELAACSGGGFAQAADVKADGKAEAKAAYDKAAAAYLTSKWEELPDAQREAYRHAARLTADQRADLAYIRQTAPEFRPPWWKQCKSTVATKIRAKIWGRTIAANFKPSDNASIGGTFDGPQWKEVEVSWNPSLVDNTSPQGGGSIVEQHDLRRGDIGEVVVWRQLGRVHFMASLPVSTIRALYAENKHLVAHLEWFHASLTSMYHCSPKGRRASMLMHCSTLQDSSGSSEAYLRACRALSSLFVAIVLEDPAKWPSVQLPFTTPEAEIEKKTGAYLYANVAPGWTLAEDRALRTALMSFYRANSDGLIKNRGKVTLPNHMALMLMEPDDRPFQEKRDEWVKKQLEKAGK